MPHVIVKLWPGKSEKQKKRLADAITRDVMEVLAEPGQALQEAWLHDVARAARVHQEQSHASNRHVQGRRRSD